MGGYDTYQTPLDSRYSSEEMKRLFGRRSRHGTWRKLWLWLAEAEKECGLDISDEAISQLASHLEVTDEDFELAAQEEKRRRHDVMSHVHVYGLSAPAAAGIIHAGATSCYITDNTELILMKDGLGLLLPKLARVIHIMSEFAMKWRHEPTLGYTHYQPDLMMDLEDIERAREDLKFRGAQGTTGTQASFMELFHGDEAKIDNLNTLLCEKAGFKDCYSISTQTYTRKVDLRLANAITGLGATVQRITSDIRHLANMKELEEPFEKDQIGSSAMAYKRNPMRSERLCSLGRKLASLPVNFSNTYSSQWLERSLDDSADALLLGLENVANGLVVYPKRIDAHNREELPFMITENVIMKIVSKGGNRQDAHEKVRVLSHEAGHVVKHEGGQNDLIERIKKDEYFKPVWDELDEMMDPKLYIGRSAAIVEKFCGQGSIVEQRLLPYKSYISKAGTAELNV
ncbi:adenylosuccinate lyase [Hypoxylon rubiginosum]|uniref:Adenylosuccinate lyase n=1 Tax=Hypoxylon rubiginosum TaxID=110542 RepID=A0ACB9Z9K4_9PEZI|nr:adenylosuccinate lyase [Hypoxylon rubiginosum]